MITFEKNDQFANDPLYNFENSDLYANSLFNRSSDFIGPFENDFRIGQTSAADGKAQLETASQVPTDVLGIDRTSSPDIGAYEQSDQN